MSLYSHIFSDLKAERYIRIGTLILFSGTALFSYAVVQQSSSKLVTHFVVELSQNLYFVGLVLTYILWAAVMKMRETRTRLIQLVLSMGVYFSLFAANFALQNLYQSRGNFFEFLTPLFGCFLPLSWAYTFWHLPEDARTVLSRLAVVPRCRRPSFSLSRWRLCRNFSFPIAPLSLARPRGRFSPHKAHILPQYNSSIV